MDNLNLKIEYIELSDEEIDEFIKKYFWKFSKTYAKFAPHEYYYKYALDDEGQKFFEKFAIFIRQKGFEAYFGRDIPKNHHIYFEHKGKYYWTMGAPISDTIILNRCNISDYYIDDKKMIYRGNHK